MFRRNTLVGTDKLGNRYYKRGTQRFICYASSNSDPAQISPAWYLWLHYAVDCFPDSFSDSKLRFTVPATPPKREVNDTYLPWSPKEC